MRLLLILFLTLLPLAYAQDTTLPLDIDGDGLLNSEEDLNNNGRVDDGETDPFNADSDGGGESDGAELAAGRNPLDRRDDFTYDLDNDGLVNGEELELGTDPANPDTDGDGINDFDDPFPLDAHYRSDGDFDGIPDEYEIMNNLSGDDPADAQMDNDRDGLTNQEEFIQGTDPNAADTDMDGITDGIELEQGEDPQENACLLYDKPLATFEDMQDHWANDYVVRLHKTKVMPSYTRIADGYGEGAERTFKPDQQISRFELLKLALLASCIPLTNDDERLSASFEDLPSTPRPYETEDRALRRHVIYTALRLNIIEGYEDNTFRPDEPVNRAEALKMLLGASKVTPPEGYNITMGFSDISQADWFFPFIKQAVELDIVEGYPDGTFRPGQSITRAEAAKLVFLLMVMNPHVNGYVIPMQGL
ncbi:MAG: S-layer homology domain-containing protein [Candidatus Peribacteraceae bacterium]